MILYDFIEMTFGEIIVLRKDVSRRYGEER